MPAPVQDNKKRDRPSTFDKKQPQKKFVKKSSKDSYVKSAPSTPAESRKIQQEKREYRKSLRTHNDLVTQAKTYWERIRDRVNVAAPERKKLIEELLKIIEGNFMDLIRKHDGSRIVQTCIKYGTAVQRAMIFKELEGHFLELAQKKYSRFLVNRFLDTANSQQKNSIFKEFYGNVLTMIKHKDACEVIEKAYQESNGFQKSLLVEEFYGNEYALFKATTKRGLADIIKENPEKKEQIMKHILEVTNVLTTKGLIYLSISHHVLNEFYDNAEPEQIRDMTSSLAPELIHTVRTRFGAMVATKCVGYATAKERKVIIKSLKGNVLPVALEPHGHMLIVKLLNVTDDTVLLSKTIVSEMIDGAKELVNDGNGRLPFMEIIAPPTNRTRYFAPPSLTLLQTQHIKDSSNNMVPSSKKDSATRRTELLAAVGEELLKICIPLVSSMVVDKFGYAVLLELLLSVEGDKAPLVDEIMSLINIPLDSEELEGKAHILLHPISSRFVKALIATEFAFSIGEETVSFANLVFEAIEANLFSLASRDYSTAIVVAFLKNEDHVAATKKKLLPSLKKLAAKDSIRGVKAIVALLGA